MRIRQSLRKFEKITGFVIKRCATPWDPEEL